MEKTYRKSWITKGILVSIKKKNKIFTINFVHQKIKKEKNHYTKIQKLQKYYSKSHKNKQGETWQDIKQIILIKKTNTKQLNGLKVNNMIINDSKSIASKFNESFVQWLRKLIRKYLNLQEVTLTISKKEI